jgi:hypothetical protein
MLDRCSEDRVRPFVRSTAPRLRRTPGWTHVFRVAFQTPGGGGPRRTARTGRPVISAWPVHPQAGRILRSLARVTMMEAADHGCLDDSGFQACPTTWLIGILYVPPISCT